MPSDLVPIAVAVGIVLLGGLTLHLSRRGPVRRVSALNARLGDQELELGARGGMDEALTQLEKLVDAKMTTTGAVDVASTRLERALDQLEQGVVICDDQGRVVFQNSRAIQLLGVEPDEGVRAKVEDLLLTAAEGRGQERTLDIPGPPPLALTVHAAPLDDKWRTVGGVLVLGDQSEQQYQEGVRRDFVSNISHELKTPVGALALLAETLSTEHDLVVVNRLARRVQVEAKRVERVVDDLIDLTRLQSEEVPVREPVALHLIVAQAAERVREQAQDKEMTINFGEPPKRLWVLGDRRQLVSAVYNLLENAVKYSPAGSLIEVRGRPGRADETGTPSKQLEISVRDEGIGIPPRDHERIFERFYRVESTRTATAGGTGLGLSIVRHVVSNHQGSVHVDSEEGLGSTFTLRLPAASAPADVRPALPPRADADVRQSKSARSGPTRSGLAGSGPARSGPRGSDEPDS
ncbi:MAG: two-component system, OmpR family, sensor histidine kinase SenX3, partial [Actinomycetota bacterium]|nr:two-component system, OmpR family, sensor histidine kinase SenX3 [Actinomycetota bacterium]